MNKCIDASKTNSVIRYILPLGDVRVIFQSIPCRCLQHWTDDYMVWEPSEYEGVSKMVVPPSKIWLPDFGIANRSAVIAIFVLLHG